MSLNVASKMIKILKSSKVATLLISMLLLSIFMQFQMSTAYAHESRMVANGKYQLRVGFVNEPVYQGLENAVFLAVCTGTCANNPDGSGTFTNGVLGAFDTLKVDITFGAQTTTLSFRAVPRTPGRYDAQFIPTRVGDYTFRVYGTLGSDTIDEKFRSGPNTFDPVGPVTDIQFPDKPGFGSAVAGTTSGAVTTVPAVTAASNPTTAAAITGNAANTNPNPTTVATGTTNSSQNSTEIQSLTQKVTDQQRQLDTARTDASNASLIGLGGVIIGIIAIVLAGIALVFGRRKNQSTPRPRREVEGG